MGAALPLLQLVTPTPWSSFSLFLLHPISSLGYPLLTFGSHPIVEQETWRGTVEVPSLVYTPTLTYRYVNNLLKLWKLSCSFCMDVAIKNFFSSNFASIYSPKNFPRLLFNLVFYLLTVRSLLIYLFIHLFIYSFIYSLIYSLIYFHILDLWVHPKNKVDCNTKLWQ